MSKNTPDKELIEELAILDDQIRQLKNQILGNNPLRSGFYAKTPFENPLSDVYEPYNLQTALYN